MRVTDITIIIIIIRLFTFSWRNYMFWSLTILCRQHFHHHMIASTFALLPLDSSFKQGKVIKQGSDNQFFKLLLSRSSIHIDWPGEWHKHMARCKLILTSLNTDTYYDLITLFWPPPLSLEENVCKLWKLWIGYSYKMTLIHVTNNLLFKVLHQYNLYRKQWTL